MSQQCHCHCHCHHNQITVHSSDSCVPTMTLSLSLPSQLDHCTQLRQLCPNNATVTVTAITIGSLYTAQTAVSQQCHCHCHCHHNRITVHSSDSCVPTMPLSLSPQSDHCTQLRQLCPNNTTVTAITIRSLYTAQTAVSQQHHCHCHHHTVHSSDSCVPQHHCHTAITIGSLYTAQTAVSQQCHCHCHHNQITVHSSDNCVPTTPLSLSLPSQSEHCTQLRQLCPNNTTVTTIRSLYTAQTAVFQQCHSHHHCHHNEFKWPNLTRLVPQKAAERHKKKKRMKTCYAYSFYPQNNS